MDPEKSPLSPRVAGVLLSVSSLPSPFGIGTLGREAFSFVDFLAAAGQKLWQVLPINPTSYGDSPYQSPASLSGNPLYIDPALLSHEGLLTSEELESAKDDATRVDYGKLFATRFPLLKTAFSRADKKDPAFLDFCRENEAWLSDYALFMTLKEEHDYKAWYLWDEEHKDYARARALIPQKAEEMRFWQWVQ